MIKIQVILGSTREGRRGDKVAKWIFGQLQKFPDVQAELLDLRDYPLPFYEDPASPSTLKGNYKSEVAKKWAQKVNESDGYILVTPEYNHGYSAVLKNALDYAYDEWGKKAVGIVSYGGQSGGIRAAEQLRLVAIELQMVPIQEAIHIQFIKTAFDEKGKPTDEERLNKKATHFLDQLLWWTKVLKPARENIIP